MNRRDIELLISAKDTTGRTFKAVAQNINELADTINRQAEAAARGELSLDKLQATQEKLGDVGKELAAIQGLIDTYEKLGGVVDRDAAQLAELQAKQAALTQTIASAGTATAAQERTLAGYEKRINSLSTSLAQNRTAFASQSAALEAAGLDANNLATAQAGIVAAATRVGQGMVIAKNGVQQFDAELFKATQSSIRAGQAIDVSFANKGLQFQENTRFLNAMVLEMERAEKQAKESAAALANFQQIGRDALQGAASPRAFVPAAGAEAELNNLANGLRAIIAPGQAAQQTLDGLEAAVAEAGAVAGREKARVSEYSDAINRLSEASANVVRQGALVDSFREQSAAVTKASAAYDKAEAEVRQFAAAVAQADAPNEELARSLKQAETAATAAGRALLTEETRLGELSRKLKTAGIDTNNLGDAQKRLEGVAKQVAAAEGQLNATLGRQGAKPGGLFGLNPYELQNLSFQVNDVVTSLASGQRPLQVLFQQGGQITQIFPGLVSGIARFALAWSGVVIPLTAVTALLVGLSNRAGEIDLFTQALNARVDGGLYDPASLEMVSRGLQDLGLSAKEAQGIVLGFVDAGLDASKLQAFSVAAVDMADALGIKAADAAKLLTDVLVGNQDAVVALNDKTHVLTDAELVHSQALFDSGKAAEARQYVFDRSAEKLDGIADRARGNWSNGVNNLRIAWSNLLDWFGKLSVFQKVRTALDEVSIGWAFLTGLIAGKSVQQAASEAVAASRSAQAGIKGQTDAREKQITTDRTYLEQLRDTTRETKNLTKAERVALAQRDARRKAAGAGLSDAGIAQAAKIAGDAEGRKADEAQSKKDGAAGRKAASAQRRAESAARKAQNEAEAAANRIKAAQAELVTQQRGLLGKTGRGDSASLEERLAGVDAAYGKIFDSIQKLRDLGITKATDGQDLGAVEASAKAAQARAVEEERLKYFEEQTNLLIKQRGEEVSGIADDQKRGATAVADAFKAAEEVNGRLSPQIIEAASKALEIARAVAGTKPNAEMTALIARLERIIGQESNQNILVKPQAEVGSDGLQKQEQDLNKLIADRNALVESYVTLVQLGAMTEDDARAKTQAAYASTATGILKQAAGIRQTIELLRQQGIITDTVYDTWLAKLQAIEAATKFASDEARAFNQALVEAVANSFTQAYVAAAQAVAGLIDGTLSLGDALQNVFTSALDIVAQFAKAIAQAIIQVIALNIAKKIVGSFSLFHGGGGVGGGSSRMTRSGVNPAAFLAAPRLHGGGGFGLASDEYAAILQRGETVLTEAQTKQAAQQGQGASKGPDPRVDVRVVNQLDSGDITEAGLQTRQGQKVLVNMIRANRSAISAAINGG